LDRDHGVHCFSGSEIPWFGLTVGVCEHWGMYIG
jgi:hypothetical protein